MEIINVLQEDLLTLVMLVGCLATLQFLNVLLGSVMALSGGEWNWTTFLKGVLKAFLVAVVMGVYCVVLEVLPLIFERANIVVPTDLVTYVQVLGIIVVALKKYVKGIYEKLLTLLDVTETEVEEIAVGGEG